MTDMRAIGIILASGSLLVTSASMSGAADFTTIELSSDATLPVAADGEFDWSGFYAGVYAGVATSPTGTTPLVGINAGVNAQFDFFLVGGEVAVQGISEDLGETAQGQILGRAGLVVTEDALVYAAGGYGIDVGSPNEQDFLLGAGAEFAVTDSISLRAQYLHSFPAQSGEAQDQVTFGAAFHF